MTPQDLERITHELMREEGIEAKVFGASIGLDECQIKFTDFSSVTVYLSDEVDVSGGIRESLRAKLREHFGSNP